MSDEYYRPTYTFPHGAYNATEVSSLRQAWNNHLARRGSRSLPDYVIQVNVVRKTGVAKARPKAAQTRCKALRRKLKGLAENTLNSD